MSCNNIKLCPVITHYVVFKNQEIHDNQQIIGYPVVAYIEFDNKWIAAIDIHGCLTPVCYFNENDFMIKPMQGGGK